MSEPLIVYWSSNSGATKALANKLEVKTLSIEQARGLADVPFILLTPTYDQPKGGHTPPQVTQWLQTNAHNLVGVIGTGNRTFGTHYCQAAKHIAQEHAVPLLTTVELMGTPDDIHRINEGITQHWHTLLDMRTT